MARKRTIQKGSVYASRGRLQIKIRVPNVVDADGKPKYMVRHTGLADTGRGRQLATSMLESLYGELYLNNGKRTRSQVSMMSELFEEFLKSKNRERSTVRGYRLAFKSIVIGDYPPSLERIEEDIRTFARRTDLKPASVNSYLRQFKAFLTWLTDEHGVTVPRKLLPRFGKPFRTDVKEFDDDEVALILSDAADPEFTRMLLVMIETGARPVDVLTLQWNQVNLKKGMLTWLNKITKREEPRPVSDTTVGALKEQTRIPDNSKVFRWSHSSLSRLTKNFALLLERVGVLQNGRTLKHLRTTFRRRLMEKGFPFEVQSYLMRHSSPDVTLNNYTLINPETIKKQLKGKL